MGLERERQGEYAIIGMYKGIIIITGEWHTVVKLVHLHF